MTESERSRSPAKERPATAAGVPNATLGEPEPLDGPVLLAPYDPDWPARFERLADRIRSALGGRTLLLEHVGSTAVPGLAAKPVIDVLLAVADAADEASYVPQLERAGFVMRIREPAWFEHRLLKCADPRLDGDVNVHVFSAGCAEVGRMLAFRDRLKEDGDDRRLYERTKWELAVRSWRTTQDYADAKAEVVGRILKSSGRLPPERNPRAGDATATDGAA